MAQAALLFPSSPRMCCFSTDILKDESEIQSMHKSKGSCKLLDLKGGRLHHVNNECPVTCVFSWNARKNWKKRQCRRSKAEQKQKSCRQKDSRPKKEKKGGGHLVPTKQNRKAIVPHHYYIQQALRKNFPPGSGEPGSTSSRLLQGTTRHSCMVQPELLGNATRRRAPAHRQNGKAEEPKRPACSLQPTRSENNQSKARHHENRRRRKSIAKNKRRLVSKCTGGR